jgi:hypothetical protein
MLAQVFGPKFSYGYLKCKSAVLCKLQKKLVKVEEYNEKSDKLYGQNYNKKVKFHIYVYNSLDELLPTF